MNAFRFSSIRSHASSAAFFIAGLGVLAVPAFIKSAYCQRAEPRPLPLKTVKHGAVSAKVFKQSVKNYEEVAYSFVARKNQRFSVSINAAPSASVYPRLYGPQGVPAIELRQIDKKTWSATLPRDSEYLLTMSRTQKTAGRSRYAFTVIIQ